MQLVAYGAQDVYLTGNPQITFWKVVYRRHTNFSTESIEMPLDCCKFGGRSNLQIQRNGDLATHMALRVHLPDLTGEHVPKGTSIAWVRRLGHALIRNVEITIGGSKIDEYTGVWLDITYELTHTDSQERGYRELIGDVDELTALSERTKDHDGEVVVEGRNLYIPMQFWFNKNSGLALPLIALQYHEVRVNIDFEEISKLIVWRGAKAPHVSGLTFREAGLLIDYVYLDSEERRKFAQSGHEYLIEQVQFNGEECLQNCGGSSTADHKYRINFNHPTKELIFAMRLGAYNGEGNKYGTSGSRGRFLTYTHDHNWEQALDRAAANIVRGMVWFKQPSAQNGSISPSDYVNLKDAGALNDVNLTNCEAESVRVCIDGCRNLNINFVNKTSSAPDKDCAWGSSNPCGFAGFVEGASFVDVGSSNIPDIWIMKRNVAVLKDNYDLASFIREATVEIGIYRRPGCDSLEARVDNVAIDKGGLCHGSGHGLTLADVSIPVEDWKRDNRSTSNEAGSCGKNPCDVVVTQPHNYGTRLDGKGNPLHEGAIQFNGQDRFKAQKGSYFNYLHPHRHHTHTPADGINIYSFALEPERHQPSGSANLSRIDSVIALLRIRDPHRAGKQVPCLDLVRDTKVYIFGHSYNVLRIMSGMGGLAYSS